MKHKYILAELAVVLLASGCTALPDNPNPPVPPLQAEIVPKPPITAEPLLWQPGHWDWTGSGYTWAPGQWVPAAGHGALWMPGYWAKSGGQWIWRPPHWTAGAAG